MSGNAACSGVWRCQRKCDGKIWFVEVHLNCITTYEIFVVLESLLATELSTLASAFPDHMVIYSGSPLPLFVKRQSPNIGPASSSVYVYANNTLPQGGILKRYQLLTPGLITILLLVFFILVPVVMVGMQALASIQTPIRVDLPKNFNAQERKNQ